MSRVEHEYGTTQTSASVPQGTIKQRVNISDPERWLSSVGGGLLIGYGLQRRSVSGVALALAGGALSYLGVSGYSPLYQALGANTAVPEQDIVVERAITINRSPEEVYNFWRNFENLPQFMQHLESVTITSEQRSHWVANGPAGTVVEWDAEIIDDQPNALISWRSLPKADVYNAGTVRFAPAPGERGTEVRVKLEYLPPAGVLGAGIAKLFGQEPALQIDGDLRRLKQVLEAGEIATNEGQPSGQRSVVGNILSPNS
jgi:uncharacterized membrane protein